jgi:hypothetical protein
MTIATILTFVADGLKLIGQLVQSRDVEDSAQILDAIQEVWEAIDGVVTKRITPDQGRQELIRLRAAIAVNDADADKALADKFDD